jgi:hypothetical protein
VVTFAEANEVAARLIELLLPPKNSDSAQNFIETSNDIWQYG